MISLHSQLVAATAKPTPLASQAVDSPVVSLSGRSMSTASLGSPGVVMPVKTTIAVPVALTSSYYLTQIPSKTRHEFGTLLAVKAGIGLFEAGLNSHMHGSPFHKALAGEALATVIGSVITTALDTTLGDRLPSKRAKDQSLAMINGLVTVAGAIGLTLWNKHVSPESAVKGLAGWSKALGLNLAIGVGEGALADWFNKRHSVARPN